MFFMFGLLLLFCSGFVVLLCLALDCCLALWFSLCWYLLMFGVWWLSSFVQIGLVVAGFYLVLVWLDLVLWLLLYYDCWVDRPVLICGCWGCGCAYVWCLGGWCLLVMTLNLDCVMWCEWLLLFGFDCCLLRFVMLSRGLICLLKVGWRFVGLVCLGFGFVVWFAIWFGVWV